MCSYPNREGQWTKQLPLWTSWNRAGLADVRRRPPLARSHQEMRRLRNLRPSDRRALAAKELVPALAPEPAGVHHVRDDHGGGYDRVAGREEVRPRLRHRSARLAVPRRQACLALGARSPPRDCRCRRELVREIWVEEAPVVGPAPAYLVVVCAASNGRASICAYCTCNMLGRLAAMPCAIPETVKIHTYVTDALPIL